MSDFATTWRLTRQRFDDSVQGLSQAQLNWRMHPDTLTIGEMAIHVAGVEVYFCTQLLKREPTLEEARIAAAARDAVINDNPFPFAEQDITLDEVNRILALARELSQPLIENPDPYRSTEIVSALGPVVDGNGGFARLAYHPGYHHAQVHMIRTAPGFPSA